LYFPTLDSKLYALNPNGTKRWELATRNWRMSPACIGPDGVIYFGSGDGNLNAANPDGTRRWQFNTGSLMDSSPAVDRNGVVYVAAGQKLYAVGADGKKRWEFITGRFIFNDPAGSSPTIAPDGTIYIGGTPTFYAVVGGAELAHSAWPMQQRDLRHSGRAAFSISITPATQEILCGADATFSASVTGEAPTGYQWRFAGVDIANATNAAMTLTNVQSAQAGKY
jgi:hypothetical protein